MTSKEYIIWFGKNPTFQLIKDQTFTTLFGNYNVTITVNEALKLGILEPSEIEEILKNNIRTFAQAKTFKFSRSINNVLSKLSKDIYRTGTQLDPNNLSIRQEAFKLFKEKIKNISTIYFKNYTQVEYDLIQRKYDVLNQTIDFWNNDNVINLTYKTQEDARVRPWHQDLNNIVLPKKDSFWARYTPPLDFNCRCYILESTDESVSTKQEVKDKKDAFNNTEQSKSPAARSIRQNLAYAFLNENSVKDLHPMFGLQHPYYKMLKKFQ